MDERDLEELSADIDIPDEEFADFEEDMEEHQPPKKETLPKKPPKKDFKTESGKLDIESFGNLGTDDEVEKWAADKKDKSMKKRLMIINGLVLLLIASALSAPYVIPWVKDTSFFSTHFVANRFRVVEPTTMNIKASHDDVAIALVNLGSTDVTLSRLIVRGSGLCTLNVTAPLEIGPSKTLNVKVSGCLQGGEAEKLDVEMDGSTTKLSLVSGSNNMYVRRQAWLGKNEYQIRQELDKKSKAQKAIVGAGEIVGFSSRGTLTVEYV